MENKNIIILIQLTFRKLSSILLVTYLPTVLMNMINQATNHITGDATSIHKSISKGKKFSKTPGG